MGDAHADAGKHTGLYMGVFAALFVGTVVTVAVSRVHFSHAGNIVVALLIAGAKASLVAAIFMHLKWEKTPYIWWPLAICAVFFVVLVALPVLSTSDHPPGVTTHSWDVLPAAAAEEHGGGH
jgi:caa(3)-type oxidase subunit IV